MSEKLSDQEKENNAYLRWLFQAKKTIDRDCDLQERQGMNYLRANGIIPINRAKWESKVNAEINEAISKFTNEC